MRKIIVLTDLHFMPEGGRIGHLDPAARFRAVLGHALTHQSDAERIIITGDLAHHGRAEEYARLRAALADCPLPVHLTLGNHDRRAAFRAAFPGAPCDDAGFVQQVIDSGDVRLILLDTLDEDAAIEHSGRLCAERLDFLQSALAGAGGRRVVIFMHHPPVDVGFDAMDAIGLADKEAFRATLARHGAVSQIVAGHVHRTIHGSVAGIPVSVLKSPCHQSPMMGPGTDTHASVDEPGAYGIVWLHDGGVIVHSEDVDVPHRRLLSYA
ncbi:phosphodiesterase [Roseovarius spongiae]|uniref:Phosphodiesterase n=1 Tax=Roseovarius spongiae TaxID=2320272 RepID=A0A3A8AWD2_9RHOB|nr:phosphodiesterase [Roseovarius spongiae]